jgi:flagellar protein FliS
MNPYVKEARRYQQNQISSASPLQLVVLLYEGTITQVSSAVRAIQVGDIQQRTNHINQACAMIAELRGTLDLQRGGEVGLSLSRLYSYITLRLCEANATNSTAKLEEVQKLLSPLWSAWQQIAEQNQAAPYATSSQPLTLAMNG